MEFWKDALGAPFKIVAPMVDASELPWRLLSRRHGAQLCYTPMLHSAIFCKDSKYRKEALATCEEDKPLIVQFCGNDPETMLEAALLAEDYCAAIDFNLGCPQAIAKRGHYGAFLQDEWELISKIVSLLSGSLKVPVTCKIRVFESVEKTICYALMLQSSGCKMLTVHGRTKEQKGPLTGLADWEYVSAVRKAVNIPVISNGNIQCMQDVYRCLEVTGAVGVMTAEGNLYNPALFEGRNLPAWEPALEYLELVETHPCPFSYVRGHLFKLFQHVLSLSGNNEIRINLGAANTLEEFRRIVMQLKDVYLQYHEGQIRWGSSTVESGTQNLILPPWLCQSFVRMPPEEHLKKVEDKQKEQEQNERGPKRFYDDGKGNQISRKMMKKLRRISRRPKKPEGCEKRNLEVCFTCLNTLGNKCVYGLCKRCCKDKCFSEVLDCPGHRIIVKTRRDRELFKASEKDDVQTEV